MSDKTSAHHSLLTWLALWGLALEGLCPVSVAETQKLPAKYVE